MGTELLEKDSTANNFTSASDCCRILTEIYKGNLVNQKASEEMLNLLKQQNLKGKIPSGLPNGIKTASKTGEMTEDQNPVLIENDIAIVLDSNRPILPSSVAFPLSASCIPQAFFMWRSFPKMILGNTIRQIIPSTT